MKIWILIVCLHVTHGFQARLPKITENPADVIVIKGDPATLRCSADGVPDPQISWFKNGNPVPIAPDDPRSHRILLPGGALFFLKVIHGRRESDNGVYWCIARNAAGIARSNNATLTVAYLQLEFRAIPQPTRAIRGESALLECEVPKGYPEPKIFWRKDGHDLELSSAGPRLKMDVNGNLFIEVVNPSDAGRYQCVASNVAGIRESPQAILSVHGRPEIYKLPQSASVLAGEDAYFECQAAGDPVPRITWFRGDTIVGTGRTLKLERVAPADQGVYVCEAESIVGMMKANATLSVFVQPTVTSTERHAKVVSGETVTFPCRAEGLPAPKTFWIKESSDNWEANGRTNVMDGKKRLVNEDGSLTLRNVEVEDGGKYVCMAVNGGGADFARTNLRVLYRRPHEIPPVIHIGPANQTLPLRSVGILQCDAENAQVTWSKNGKKLVPQERFSIDEHGTLRIEGLQTSDSALYECTARNEAGETRWTAKLSVESPTNPNIVFYRTSTDPLALPGSPSQPRVLDRSAHSITIGWKSGSRMGASPSVGYMVEYLSTEEDLSKVKWKIATRRLQSDLFTLTNISIGSAYLFVVRAENLHGLSLPSPASEWAELQDSDMELESSETTQIRDALSVPGIRFDAVTALNTTAVQLQWEVIESEVRIDSIIIFWQLLGEPESSLTTYAVEPTIYSIVIGGLEPGSTYEFFLVPTSKGLIGRPTKCRVTRTIEELPLPLIDLQVQPINSSTIRASVRPSLTFLSQRKYMILITPVLQPSSSLKTTLFPDTSVLLIGGLKAAESYAAQIYAVGRVDSVAVSPSVSFTMMPNGITSAVSEGRMDESELHMKDIWFAVLIGCLLSGSMVIFVAAFFTRKKMLKNKERSSSSVASKSGTVNIYKSPDIKPGAMRGWEFNDKEGVNFRLLPQAIEIDAVYAEVNHGPSFSSFQRRQQNYYSSSGFGEDPIYRTYSKTKLYSAPLAFSDASTGGPYASSSGASIYEPEMLSTYDQNEETPIFYQSVPIPLGSSAGRIQNGSLRKGTVQTVHPSPRSIRRNNLNYHLAGEEDLQAAYERSGLVQIEFMRSHH